jgi:endonuclease/exonuclease/phosphatase family metal-dependent hydrolase
VLLVSANLHEIDYPDAGRIDDLKRFVKRLDHDLSHRPDVLALQEIAGHSAETVAALLTNRFNDRYRVVVVAGDPPWKQLSATKVLGVDSAILVNARTMRTPRHSGHVRIDYPYKLSTPGQESRVKMHPIALVKERKGGLAVPIASVHFPKTELFRNRRVSQKLKRRWMARIDKALARAYPGKRHRRMRVIAGDLNNKRCMTGRRICRATPAYKLTKNRLNYTDAFQALNGWGNPIDFIFSRPAVVSSGWDFSASFNNRSYSDHGYRWALLERNDTTAPTSPKRIRQQKGNRKFVKLAHWDKARDGGTGLARYVVKRSRKGSSRGFHIVGKSEDRKFKDFKVKAGVRYWYRVIAVDRAGNRSRRSRSAGVRAGKPIPKKSKPKPEQHPNDSDEPKIEIVIPPRHSWGARPQADFGIPPDGAR